jgi:glyoxylase-like metal-dependent hydrolase (beta-lactamase superfamily II)
MLLRQLFDCESSTYTYLLAARAPGKAVLIDPVRDQIATYLRLLDELELELEMAFDTHVHADHITALGELRDRTGCVTIMGEEAHAACVSRAIHDGDVIAAGGLEIEVWHTPGHTPDSYCYLLEGRVFTGDTLLIRGTGRTDFQGGDARAAWRSLERLMSLPDKTLVHPAHDYKGWTVSTIGEERRHNPRLQVSGAEEYAHLMGSLNLPDPRMMDVAVAANRACGMV